MTEYAIIAVLSIALIWQTAAKRYWRKRATGKGFWGLVEKQIAKDAVTANRPPRYYLNSEWPELIDKQ